MTAQATMLYAPWRARVQAGMIDAAVCCAITAGIVVAAGGDFEFRVGFEGTSLVLLVLAGFYGLLYGPLLLARHGSHNGQTLGKQWSGIRVVMKDGRPISGYAAFWRELIGKVLLGYVTIGTYTVFDVLVATWGARRRSLHDRLAGTSVILA